MTQKPTPQRIVEGMLRGIAPPRPLFLPIVFSLGAKLENLPLASFLGNPTKISNSVRQIRSHLRADGLTCYFDPYLEAEALGATLDWNSGDHKPIVCWSGPVAKGKLPDSFRAPDDAAKRGRIGVAVDVIRRLKSLVHDQALIMAGVTGPFTLAARITRTEAEDPLCSEDIADTALDIAASMTRLVSQAFVEAGANVIFIQESVLPLLTAESCEAWAPRLSPVVNVIRFYQALPVLLLTNTRAPAEERDVTIAQRLDCIICPVLDVALPLSPAIPADPDLLLGAAIPLAALRPDEAGDEDFDRFVRDAISAMRPAVLTTAGDVLAEADVKRLVRISRLIDQT